MAAKSIDLVFDTDRSNRSTCSATRDASSRSCGTCSATRCKFTPPGGRIEVTTRASRGSLELRVTDNGVGIDEQFLPFVFERFKQGDGRYSRQWGGLGIGLAICWDLVTLHGGHIPARSEGPGRGATFEVKLPLATAAEAATSSCGAPTVPRAGIGRVARAPPIEGAHRRGRAGRQRAPISRAAAGGGGSVGGRLLGGGAGGFEDASSPTSSWRTSGCPARTATR